LPGAGDTHRSCETDRVVAVGAAFRLAVEAFHEKERLQFHDVLLSRSGSGLPFSAVGSLVESDVDPDSGRDRRLSLEDDPAFEDRERLLVPVGWKKSEERRRG